MAADRLYVERQALTRTPNPPTAPTRAPGNHNSNIPGDQGVGSPVAGDGLYTPGLLAIIVTVIANSGATLSGGGSLDCWFYDVDVGLWGRMPENDLSMTWANFNGASTARQVRYFPPFRNTSRLGGYLNWLSNGVTVSQGGDTLIRLSGFMSHFPS